MRDKNIALKEVNDSKMALQAWEIQKEMLLVLIDSAWWGTNAMNCSSKDCGENIRVGKTQQCL